MQQENDDNVLKVNRPDQRTYEAQDNEGHLKGSRQEGNSREKMEKLREEEANDQSSLNKTDIRETVSGNETV